MKNNSRNIQIIISGFALLIIALAAFTGCQLEAAESASLTVSARQYFGARGFYGTSEDVEWIDIYIYADPADSGESSDVTNTDNGGADTSDDNLVAMLTLNAEGGWDATAPDVPTMTDLRIEAYAYGDTSLHNYDAIGWDVDVTGSPDDADASGITMFTGTTSKYISSATATIYLVLLPYNDGSLQRLPRIAGMVSNLNEAQLRIDFNDYGLVTWPDTTTSYEQWYWRIVEANGERADSSFIYNDSVPEASFQFNDLNTQAAQEENSIDHDIVLNYLFPDDNADGIVEWYERVYYLEIANPQHNVLRQAFVMNPGADTLFDINFAPWIRNITAGRYDLEFAGDSTAVVWEADVADDTTEAVRYLWILNLDSYWAVYGDLTSAVLHTDSQYADWSGWIDGMAAGLDAQLSLQDRTALSRELALVLSGTSLSNGTGVDSWGTYPDSAGLSSVMTAAGGIFDEPSVEGRLYLLVFDSEFEIGGTFSDNLNGYDDYSWSYVRMDITPESFPSVDGGGLVVFE